MKTLRQFRHVSLCHRYRSLSAFECTCRSQYRHRSRSGLLHRRCRSRTPIQNGERRLRRQRVSVNSAGVRLEQQQQQRQPRNGARTAQTKAYDRRMVESYSSRTVVQDVPIWASSMIGAALEQALAFQAGCREFESRLPLSPIRFPGSAWRSTPGAAFAQLTSDRGSSRPDETPATNQAGSISLPLFERFGSVHEARLKQQGRRLPLFIFEMVTSTRRLRVSEFCVALTQRTHSQRAIGVIALHRSWIF